MTFVADVGTGDEEMEKYGSYLKSLYKIKSLEPCVSDLWPTPATEKIFRLAMIKSEETKMKSTQDEFLHQKTIAGRVDDVLDKSAQEIELKDIFQGTDRSKMVLIFGAPGSGKSTLSLQICHLWSEEKLFQEYKLVILVKLRDPTVQNAKSVIDILPSHNAKSVGNLLEACFGDNVLFVLDGWDELPSSAPGYSVILDLVKRTQLHKCAIVVTSRPSSLAKLCQYVSSRVEILGFTRDELRKFFTDCLKNNTVEVDTLLKKIKDNPVVEGSCYLPMNASIIVHLFKDKKNLHFSSQYSIFSALVLSCIIRHLEKSRLYDEVPAIDSLDNLPPEIDQSFKFLCELAYKGIIDDRVTFDILPGSGFNTLGLLQGVENLAGFRSCRRSYCFLHLSIQEILAAIYIATQFSAKKQTSSFKTLLGQARFNAVFGFYAAKTKLRTPGINDVVMTIVGKCTVEDPEQEHKSQLLSVFHCLFEAQDPSLCQLVMDQRVKHTLNFENFVRFFKRSLPDHISELDLSETGVNPFDCLSIGFFLYNINSDIDVDLRYCHIGPEECKALFRAARQPYHIRKLK